MTITCTGPGIPLYRLLALRQGIRLEARGLRVGHRSMTALVKRELHVTGNRDKVLAALDAVIEAQGAIVRMTPGSITVTGEEALDA